VIGTSQGSLESELVGGVLPWVLVVGAAGFVPALSATRGWIASPVQLGVGLCALTAATYLGGWGPAELYAAIVCLTLPYFIVATVAVATGRPGALPAETAATEPDAAPPEAEPNEPARDALLFDDPGAEPATRHDRGEADDEGRRRAA